MNKIELLNDIIEQFVEGCVINTQEIFNQKPIVGHYYFDTLEMAIEFFTNEYNDDLVRENHNTQILSWEVKV
jgi:hypothetical protein